MSKNIKIETYVSDKLTMDYIKFGHGSNTLVILPGLSVQSVMLLADAVADAYDCMTNDFTIYLFDRRKNLPSVYTQEDMALDAAEAIIGLGLKGVYLFGTSQGGMMSLVIAAQYPELVNKMVIGSGTSKIEDKNVAVFSNWIDLAREGNAEELYVSFCELLYSEEMFKQSRDLFIELSKTVTKEELERFVVLAGAAKDFDVTDRLSEIKCPVLVIGNKDDKVLGGEASEIIADNLINSADCELYMYDGYGHASYDTAPDYKERITAFLLKENNGR